jgi:hypothetical protein
LASPALLDQRRKALLEEVDQFTKRNKVPVVTFKRGERKDDIAAGYRRQFGRDEGVVFLGVAQERCMSFKGQKRTADSGFVSFDFSKQSVFVNQLYYYLEDLNWGPAFLKMSTYVPYSIKLCLNGHEWAKRQLLMKGIHFESLDNGFLSCADPDQLQVLCDQLGPKAIEDFFDHWSHILPWPLSEEERVSGYNHRLSLWQIEVSLTHVFDRPVHGRQLFEQIIRENLDLGRPDRVRLLFPLKMTKATPPPKYGYRTRVITEGVNPSLHVDYKSCHVKQYFKEERALRTETTINNPGDFHVRKGLPNLWQLKKIGDDVNERVLATERLAQDCLVDRSTFEQHQRPIKTEDGHRVSALRFGDERVMALFAALCLLVLQPAGFRNRQLRDLVASLLGETFIYSRGRMTYDLRRLRRRQLIYRVPNTNLYFLTTEGLRLAFLCSKTYQRILQPAWASLNAPIGPESAKLAKAFKVVEQELERLQDAAQLAPKLDSSVNKAMRELC